MIITRVILILGVLSITYIKAFSPIESVTNGIKKVFHLGDEKGAFLPKADKVLVIKSKRELYLIKEGKVYKTYHISLGGNPKGAKEREHDRKTPEGNYTLDFKNPRSHYYKAIHISYPNKKDMAKARKLGVSPGGDIMIHGQPNHFGWLSFIRQRFNWTAGCIAVSNSDMDEIWKAVKVGIPIEIRP